MNEKFKALGKEDQQEGMSENTAADVTSLASRGSDRRLVMTTQTPTSGTKNSTLDDWLTILVAVALFGTAIFGGLCVALHGENKRFLIDSRAFNTTLLVSGCVTMFLQLMCTCLYASQWLTGV